MNISLLTYDKSFHKETLLQGKPMLKKMSQCRLSVKQVPQKLQQLLQLMIQVQNEEASQPDQGGQKIHAVLCKMYIENVNTRTVRIKKGKN